MVWSWGVSPIFGGSSNFGGSPILEGSPIFWGSPNFLFFFFQFFPPQKISAGIHHPPKPPPGWSMCSWYASYWNAFLFKNKIILNIKFGRGQYVSKAQKKIPKIYNEKKYWYEEQQTWHRKEWKEWKEWHEKNDDSDDDRQGNKLKQRS